MRTTLILVGRMARAKIGKDQSKDKQSDGKAGKRQAKPTIAYGDDGENSAWEDGRIQEHTRLD